MIRILKGVSGYRKDRTPFRFSRGSEVYDTPELEATLVNAGLAEVIKSTRVKLEEPPRRVAITPTIETVKAVIKRGRKPHV